MILLLVSAALLAPETALAQGTQSRPRRQFFTVTVDQSRTKPLHFKEFPLEQLVGREVGIDRSSNADYRTSDGLTTVHVHEFQRPTRGAGLAVYPLGIRSGPALMIRLGYETLPVIRFDITSPNTVERYTLADGRAYDFGLGVMVADRPAGWGLGAHSFVAGGIGRLRGERGNGDRAFGEGGGGISFGPLGLQVVVKIAYNRFKDPRPHAFYTVPVSLRGTVSF